MSNLAKLIAERINGGKWEDPQYYTPEQQQLWIFHAEGIARDVKGHSETGRLEGLIEGANIALEVSNLCVGPAADGARSVELAIMRRFSETRNNPERPHLRPMSSAPKDRPILVRFDHDGGDGYYREDGKGLTLYGAHAEGLSCRAGEGWCVAVWGGGFHDSEEDGGAHLPDWWFQDGSEHEIAVNPVGWVDIDLGEKA